MDNLVNKSLDQATSKLNAAVDVIFDKSPQDQPEPELIQAPRLNYRASDEIKEDRSEILALNELLAQLLKYAQSFPDPSLWRMAKDMSTLVGSMSGMLQHVNLYLHDFRRAAELRAPDVLVPRLEDMGLRSRDGKPICGLDTAIYCIARMRGNGSNAEAATPGQTLAFAMEQSKKRHDMIIGLAYQINKVAEEALSNASTVIHTLGQEHATAEDRKNLMHVAVEYTDGVESLLEGFDNQLNSIVFPESAALEESEVKEW